MANANPTQNARIIHYMRRYGSITSRDAMVKLGVMRLASRIFELRAAGYNIGDVFETVPDRFGNEARIKRYFIVDGGTDNVDGGRNQEDK